MKAELECIQQKSSKKSAVNEQECQAARGFSPEGHA